MTLTLDPSHLAIMQTILKKYPYTFYVFGSRVKGASHKFSDLDLLYFDEIPPKILCQLEEDFEESDLPFKVDLVNYHGCDEGFRKCIGGYLCLGSSSSQTLKGNSITKFFKKSLLLPFPKITVFKSYVEIGAFFQNSL